MGSQCARVWYDIRRAYANIVLLSPTHSKVRHLRYDKQAAGYFIFDLPRSIEPTLAPDLAKHLFGCQHNEKVLCYCSRGFWVMLTVAFSPQSKSASARWQITVNPYTSSLIYGVNWGQLMYPKASTASSNPVTLFMISTLLTWTVPLQNSRR